MKLKCLKINHTFKDLEFNPLRPIAALAAIIDSTYSRRHKSAKSALERSNQVYLQKMTIHEKITCFSARPPH